MTVTFQERRRSQNRRAPSTSLASVQLMDRAKARKIGERIAGAREVQGFTQVQVADMIGVSERSYQGYELGEVIPFKRLESLSQVLNVSTEWLLHGTEPEQQASRDILDALLRIEQLLRDKQDPSSR